MRKKVVVLEDDKDIREIITYVLEACDIQVVGYETLSGFLSSAKPYDADLILLDLMLPDGSGREACYHLQQDELTANIPIIMMSAYIEGIRANGCKPVDFISKPFDIDDFVHRITARLKTES